MSKPSMLITGGSGYLGDWVVRLARAGWQVHATYFTRPGTEAGAHWQRLELRDAAAVTALVEAVRPRVIVHTAAVHPGASADFEGVNVRGTRHVAQAAAHCGAHLIHLSSDVVFDGEKGHYVESDPPHPLTDYGRSKAQAETEVAAAGVESLIVRTSLIYGWQPHIDRQTRWITTSLRDDVPLRLFTDELRCPIWVETLATAIVELAALSVTGILHITGAQTLSRYEFGVRLARFHGLDPTPIIAARSRESGLNRPLDCTLNCSHAQTLLQTTFPGVDAVLAQHRPTGDPL
ncbi:MAG: SDR family oxidoreductase [Anaerolineae bacterium]|nr:SDR family oxidoreductase [Anaerolineae bacterium]